MLQTADPAVSGFIEREILARGGDCYCRRCFRLRHYGKLEEQETDANEHGLNLAEIAKEDALILYVVDAFFLEATLDPAVLAALSGKAVVLVVNKVDLLGKYVSLAKMFARIKRELIARAIGITEVVFTSVKIKETIAELVELIRRESAGRNIYFVGMTNVGKSSLINAITEYYTGTGDLITIAPQRNTTLANIYLPFTADSALIDTPGIVTPLFHDYLQPATLAAITPQTPLRPVTYQLNPEQIVFLGGFAAVEFISGRRSSFVVFAARKLVLHRRKAAESEFFFARHRFDLLQLPVKSEATKLGAWTAREEQEFSGQGEIVFPGLAVVKFVGEGRVRIWALDKLAIKIRKGVY